MKRYFDEIYELAKKIPQSEKNKAERARKTIISTAVQNIRGEAKENGTV